MRRGLATLLGLLLVMGLSAVAFAGPGSVVIKTDGDITATFGAQVRVIPVYEQDWDFGIKNKTVFGKTNPLGGVFLNHLTEAGVVNRAYIRSEDRLYFNFAKGDIWDVYMALEFDDVLSSRTVDRVRDVQGNVSSFGLERLSASIKLPWIFSRFYAGWDIYAVDLDTALLVYGDDDPGFWLKGGVANVDWQFGYHKKEEANRAFLVRGGATLVNTGGDNDRDILSFRVNYTLFKDTKIGLIYTWDRLALSNVAGVPVPPCGPTGPTCPEVDSHHIGPVVIANIAGFKFTGQYVHQFGEARKTGVNKFGAVPGSPGAQDYDIDAHAFLADLAYDLTPWIGFRLIPHVGVIWASGDDNPNDSTLGGYVGNVDGQRFTPIFGGENTILADNNNVIGTNLYSFVPNLRGNQNSGLVTGGFLGTGRGDSPGILLVGGGITVAPTKNSIYRTNAYYLRYDEKPCVNPGDFPLLTPPPSACPADSNIISHREIGVGWDNEIMVWLDKNMVVKGQFSFLFPGDAVKDLTRNLVGQPVDETAIRLALELLWNF